MQRQRGSYREKNQSKPQDSPCVHAMHLSEVRTAWLRKGCALQIRPRITECHVRCAAEGKSTRAVQWRNPSLCGFGRAGEGWSEMKKQLQVMKFGGTSVGDASCIARAAKIIVDATNKYRCVAVVSAMSGVTNRLIEAANHARAGNAVEAAAILEALRKLHEIALTNLIPSEKDR